MPPKSKRGEKPSRIEVFMSRVMRDMASMSQAIAELQEKTEGIGGARLGDPGDP